MSRINDVEYGFELARTVARRCTCNRGRAGAVIMKDGRIISAGYAGAPSGQPHCDDVGHLIQKRRIFNVDEKPVGSGSIIFWPESQHCIRTVHAELNAIIHAARFGVSVYGSQIFCTMFPCYDCAKAIVNAGIKIVYAINDYQQSERSKKLFRSANVIWEIKTEDVISYE